MAEILWRPPANALSRTRVGDYLQWLRATRGLAFADHDELWAWSVADLEGFWSSVWEYFGIESSVPYRRVLSARTMPGASWFEGARLNYAQHIVGGRFADEQVAVLARSQTRPPLQLTYGELTAQVASARAGLIRLGVRRGDRVVAYVPNVPEALVAFLACASIGAIWASCASEFGARSVVDRCAQIEPVVLVAAGSYCYGDKVIDRRLQVAEITAALPTLRHVIVVPYGPHDVVDCTTWEELLAGEDVTPPDFEQVPFDHPLYVLFSSGTTGLPKAIVHGHGAMLIEHVKNHGLSWDLGPDDRFMWFTTTAWMMWNALVSALLLGTAIVMLDGNPLHPDVDEQWRLAAETGATTLGLSPAFIMTCRKHGLHPAADHDLSRLRQVCSAGSPLSPEGARWIVEELGPDVMLNNGSGGTDVCTGIVQGNPLVPAYAGEIAARCLGVRSAAYDEAGREVVGALGELVITEPMPSMPVGLWNDPGDARYRSTYFEHFPGVWRQGDWIRFSPAGTSVITGRSDATLNRGGVRLGTGEFYAVVEELPEVVDSLVVHLEDAEGGLGELLLFVVLAPGVELDDELRGRISVGLRQALSPRHIPDTVVAMPGVPRSLTGKKLELPVKRILQGADPATVASRDALADPAALDVYATYAKERRT